MTPAHLAIAQSHRRAAFALLEGWRPLARGALTGYPRAHYRALIEGLRAYNRQAGRVLP